MTSSTVLPTPVRRWVPRASAPDDPRAADGLARELGIPAPLCRLLVQRGYGDAAAAKGFLRPSLDELHDPLLMKGMARAVERIGAAIRDGETILVHGDYDVDGICSTALYTRVLRSLGAHVVPFVPDRSDGYDLGPAGIRAATEAGARLVLTADCGIVAHEAVEAARTAGLDVIVTDHHTPGAALPEAVAVLNPKREGCAYPEKGLAGVGVSFKLCQALWSAHGRDEQELLYHLDLVAVATIADLVPLSGENRVLARYGLRVLKQTRNPGLRALLQTAGLGDRPHLQAGQVSHVLGPRINAVGRIGRAMRGVELLLTDESAAATRIAQRLEEHNRDRRALDRRILDEALALLERDFDADRDYGVVLAGEGWHPGVIGIVASRIVERIHRPAVLIALPEDDGFARGSARSIRGFDLYAAVDACSAHLERFGGHKQAAGLDIRPDRIDAFRDAFGRHARGVLSPDDLVGEVETDLEIRLGEATSELYRYLRHFGPFGIGNPAPVFVARGISVAGYPKVVGKGHLKMELAQDGARLEAIGFGMADRLQRLDIGRVPIDVAFQLQENHWRGRVTLQARLVDIRAAEG